MNRHLPHRVNYVEKIDYIQTDASGEGISEIPTSFLWDRRARLSNLYGSNEDVTLSTCTRPHGNAGIWKKENSTMSAFVGMPDELIGAVEMSKSGDRNAAVYALALQLPFCFEVRAPSDRLVSSAPE